MELKITNEHENPLFNRKELQGTINADLTPNKQEVAKIIAEKYKTSPENLRVLYIKGNFGKREFEFKANIYSSKKERDEIELISKKEAEAESKAQEQNTAPEKIQEETQETQNSEKTESETKIPAEEAIGLNPVEEAKKQEEKQLEEDKKEKDKTPEEKQLEK